MGPPRIEGLRRRLAAIDGELQRAIGRRLAVARAIGAEKRRLGLPLRDEEVERRVIARWQRALEREGVVPTRAARVARWLVDEAVRAQRTISVPGPGPARGRPHRILVVGGVGAMGRWLVTRLIARGHSVSVLDPNARGVPLPRSVRVEKDLTAARRADVVVIATPIPAAARIYEGLLGVRFTGTILDVLSVKAPIVRWIRAARARGISVASVHPMFGPRSFDVSGRLVLVVDCGDRRANRLARALLADAGVRTLLVPLEEHDRWMGELQVLPRAAGLAFAAALAGPPESARRRQRVGPPSFQRQLEVTRASLREDADLTWDLLTTNPHALPAARRAAGELAILRALLESGDPAGFRRYLRRARTGVGHPSVARPRSAGAAPARTRRPRRGPPGRRRPGAGAGRSRGASRPTSPAGSPA